MRWGDLPNSLYGRCRRRMTEPRTSPPTMIPCNASSQGISPRTGSPGAAGSTGGELAPTAPAIATATGEGDGAPGIAVGADDCAEVGGGETSRTIGVKVGGRPVGVKVGVKVGRGVKVMEGVNVMVGVRVGALVGRRVGRGRSALGAGFALFVPFGAALESGMLVPGVGGGSVGATRPAPWSPKSGVYQRP